MGEFKYVTSQEYCVRSRIDVLKTRSNKPIDKHEQLYTFMTFRKFQEPNITTLRCTT